MLSILAGLKFSCFVKSLLFTKNKKKKKAFEDTVGKGKNVGDVFYSSNNFNFWITFILLSANALN